MSRWWRLVRRIKAVAALAAVAVLLAPVPATLSRTRMAGIEVHADEQEAGVDADALRLRRMTVPSPAVEADLSGVATTRGSSPPVRTKVDPPCDRNRPSMDAAAIRLNTSRSCTTAAEPSSARARVDEIHERVRDRIARRRASG